MREFAHWRGVQCANSRIGEAAQSANSRIGEALKTRIRAVASPMREFAHWRGVSTRELLAHWRGVKARVGALAAR